MFLFSLPDIVQVPFGWLLSFLYEFTQSYGWALILFSLAVKLVLLVFWVPVEIHLFMMEMR